MSSVRDTYGVNALLEHQPSKADNAGIEDSHLGYSWRNFETEEDLAEDELYSYMSRAQEPVSLSSSCRDPYSPIDEWDLEEFEVRTAELASYTDDSSCHESDLRPDFAPGSPVIRKVDTLIEYDLDSQDSPPPPMLTLAHQQELLVAIERLEHRVNFLETTVEQNHNSLEQEILAMSKKLSDGISGMTELLTSLLHQGVDEILMETGNSTGNKEAQPSKSGESLTDHHTSAAELEDEQASYQTPELSPTEKYFRSWHAGGLILVEHLSEQTPARDIHALFQQFGRITYLELNGADKSKPWIPTRYALIHYAEQNAALQARRFLHGFHFQNQNLMVFAVGTAVIRGEPGKPYIGSALEVLNFNGGLNYAAPEADCFQVENEGLMQLNGESLMKNEQATTYSLKPCLTTKTAASSWRRMEVPVVDPPMQHHHDMGGEEILFQGRPVRNHPTLLHTIDECDNEDGGVRLGSEAEDDAYLDYEYQDSDDEDLECYAPMQPREFF
ncbi:MAG: hypothetical protein Q9170_001353 [Blastenia crenularia]